MKQFRLSKEHEAIIVIENVYDINHAAFVWPCGLAMAAFVSTCSKMIPWLKHEGDSARLPPWYVSFYKKHLLELGAGTCISSLACLKLGYAKSVTLTERHDNYRALEKISQIMHVNSVNDESYFVLPLSWGDCDIALEQFLTAEELKVEIIICSDCFYDAQDFDNILCTLKLLLTRFPHCVALIAYQERSARRCLHELMIRWSFECILVPPLAYQCASLIDRRRLARKWITGDLCNENNVGGIVPYQISSDDEESATNTVSLLESALETGLLFVAMALRKLGQLKQWTGEKLGQSKRTETSEEFKALLADFEAREASLSSLLETLRLLLKSLDEKKKISTDRERALPRRQLANAMFFHAGLLKSDSSFGKALKKMSTSEESLARHQDQFLSNARSTLEASLLDFSRQMKEFHTLRKKLESHRLDYDSKQSRIQSSRKERPELVEEMLGAQQKYEKTLSEAEALLLRLQAEEDNLLESLQNYANSQRLYFEKCLATMDESLNEINKRSSSDQSPMRAEMSPPVTQSQPNLPPPVVPRFRRQEVDVQSRSVSTPPPPPVRRRGLKVVQVQFNFEPENDNELRLSVGDVVTVLEYVDESWWLGECRGVKGIFPCNHTLELSSHVSQASESPVKRALALTGSDQAAMTAVVQAVQQANINTETIVESCGTCNCRDFVPNVFKRDSCNNCFHKH